MNEINLRAFQFEFDLTWMAFFQNAEGKTYARYGGREDDGPDTHLTKTSLVRTMQRVLELHEQNGVKPWSKYDPKPEEIFTPEQIPPMRTMLGKRKEKCIHCHDVKNAMFHDLANQNKLRKDDVFSYPSPRRLGIHLDGDDQSKVKAIEANSAAAKAGVRQGDRVTAVDGQRVLTFADFTRVLELAPEKGVVNVTINQAGSKKDLKLTLAEGWRRSPDPSWRSSTSVVGPNSGFWAKQLGPNELRKRKLSNKDLALKVVVVWGAWAKQAGIRNGDIVVGIDGLSKKMGIRQLQTHLQMHRDFGEKVKVKVLRGGKVKELTMTLPKHREIH